MTEPFKAGLANIHDRLLAVILATKKPLPKPKIRKPHDETQRVAASGTSAGLTPDEASAEVAKILAAHPDSKIELTVTWSKGEGS